MKFKKIYQLNELFKQWKYQLPKDKEDQLFDFYMLVTMDKPNNPDLRIALEDAQNTITSALNESLKNAIWFAVAAEFRHIFSSNNAKNIKTFFDKYNMKNFIKDYAISYKLRMSDMSEFSDRIRTELVNRFKENSRGYIESLKALQNALKKNNIKDVVFMEVAAMAFKNLQWDAQYGGTAWANIANGWIRLNKAKNMGDRIVAIDHAYDLQHNTGTVFTKLKSYYKDGYSWLKKALDKKANAKDQWELYDDISSKLKSFIPAVLKDTKGQTLEDWLKKKNPTTKQNKIKSTSSDIETSVHPVSNSSLDISSRTKYDLLVHAFKTNKILSLSVRNIVIKNVVELGSLLEDDLMYVLDGIPNWFINNLKNVFYAEIKIYSTVKDGEYSFGWAGGIWKNGTWEGAVWENGTWENGHWLDGVWEEGHWAMGIWDDGLWRNGKWFGGDWRNGTWKNGSWFDGVWHRGTWKDGIWKRGIWKNGTWMGGLWETGYWQNGTWQNGTWQNGTWMGGFWQDGTWKNGTWKNGTWKSPDTHPNKKNESTKYDKYLN